MDPMNELTQKMNEAMEQAQEIAARLRATRAHLDHAQEMARAGAPGAAKTVAHFQAEVERLEAEWRAINERIQALQIEIDRTQMMRLRERIPLNPRAMERPGDAAEALKQDLDDVREAARVLVERIRATFEDWVVAKRRHGEYAWDAPMLAGKIEEIIAEEARDLLRLIPGTLIDEYRRKL